MKKYILLFGIMILSLMGINKVSAQTTMEWTGVVVSAADGSALAGARLSVNEEKSVITDESGAFTLRYEVKLPSANNVLTISLPGYASRIIYLKESQSLKIALHEDGFKGMEQKVIMPLSGEVSSTVLPYSVVSVSPDERHQTASTPDVLMQGTVAGLNTIFRSGQPGSGSNMYLQGYGSLNANSQPMILLDGMPYENYGANSLIEGYQTNPLSAIEVKDVESITVLKDGTSLYGTKGANGVIFINTIRAKDAATQINVHLHGGISYTPQSAQVPLLDASQYKSYLTDLLMSSGNYTAEQIQDLPYINQNKPVADAYNRYTGNTDYYRYNNQTDWQDMAYQLSFDQDYYVSVKGGDETALYALSMGYLTQEGSIAGTGYNRFSARFNSDINITKRFKSRTGMSFSYGQRLLQSEGGASVSNILYNSMVKAPFTAPYIYSESGNVSPNMEDADIFGVTNVQSIIDNTVLRNLNYRFLGTLGLNYAFDNGISLDGMFGMHFNKDRERIFYPSEGYEYESLPNADVSNMMQHRVERWFILYGDIHAQYSKKINYHSSLKANLGARFQNTQFENDYGLAYNSASDDFQSLGYGSSDLRQAYGSIGAWNWLSMYANVDFQWQNKYTLSAILTSDHSSHYGEEAAYLQWYPSIAASWLMCSNTGNSAVNMMKLRASAGVSGNDDIGNYTGRKYYVSQSFLGSYGLQLGALTDTDLLPESTTKFNLGWDAAFLNEHVDLSIDVYHHRVNDMLTMTMADSWTGFPYYLSNGGSMTNTGMDVDLNLRIVNSKLFKWDFHVLASNNHNEVTSLDGGSIETEINGATILTQVGQPLGVFYGYQTEGVYGTQAEAAADGYYLLNGSVPSYFGGGDVRFVNQTGEDKLINEADRVIIGNPNPDLYGSITNRMSLGRLGLLMQFNYSLGNDVYNGMRCTMESMSNTDNQTIAVLNRWRYDGQITEVPKATYGDPMGNSRFSDRWIEDGSYIRLKSLTLSYDFPNLFQGSSIFVSAENLWTMTQCKLLDPEFSSNANPLYYGVGSFTAPMPKMVYLGVKIGL